jgi:CheY-like chemotaxis protein
MLFLWVTRYLDIVLRLIEMDVFVKIKNMNLLLVDDDEWIRDSLTLFFESEGCKITALETAEEALKLFQLKRFDVIIADYRLPGMDGLEFIKNLPKSQSHALKILITAHGNQDIFTRAQRIGVDACIAKPFTSETIEGSLQRLIA